MGKTPVQSDHDVNSEGQKLLPASIPPKPDALPVPHRSHPGRWEIILQLDLPNVPLVRLTIAQEAVLGRADPSEGFIPQIDLTAFGAKELGLSRWHAAFCPSPEGLFLRDLDSMNGTFLNSTALAPKLPYALQGGDEIRLGNLRMVVRALRVLEGDRRFFDPS